MIFAIGFIAGLAIANFLFLGLIFLRLPIEKQTKKIERRIAKISPHNKGFIVQADDEATIARNAIVERNRKLGKDTPLTDLYENT